MLRIVCINAGNYEGRGVEYVNTLFDMARRNLPPTLEGEFICFTDDRLNGTGSYDEGIVLQPPPSLYLKGWFQKLALFRAGLFAPGDRIVYFDLDTVITGRLDEIVAYDGAFAALEDFFDPDHLQSSVMLWPAGFGENLWNEFVWAGRPDVPGGDQAWIEKHLTAPYPVLQRLFPDTFVSYKASGGEIPKKASVVCFHGKPRPHEVTTGWVPEVWKIGGMQRADLDTLCNTEMERLYENVRINSVRDLPWLQPQPPHDGHVVIVGGGPSVKDKVEEIRWRASLGQAIWALNGAAGWLHRERITTDVQIIVDARPQNITFMDTRVSTYLLASQCDPFLFELAITSRADVCVWHSNAPGVADIVKDDERASVMIGGGSTVGLSAMTIASVLGFRYVHLYGYDSSFADDEHHAYPQDESELAVDVMVDYVRFRAAPWMVHQAQEFVPLARELVETSNIEVITVAGEGLLPYLARDMSRTPPKLAVDVRATEILSRLPEGPVVGAEIGVFGGDLSSRLLQRPDLTLIMVDPWSADGKDMIDKQDFHAHLTQEQQDAYYEMTKQRVAFAGERAKIIRKTSLMAEEDVENGSLDFVFIDADHAYDAISLDIFWWYGKVKKGGLLCGHDYANDAFPHFGVTRAVDEFVEDCGLTLEIGENFCWFVRIPEAARIAAEQEDAMTTKKDDDDDKVKTAAKPDAKKEGAEEGGSKKITADLSEASVTISTKDDVTGITEGMSVSGDGIAPGATVVRTGPGAIVLTQSATKSATGVELLIG